MDHPLAFGLFHPPYHPTGQNPTLALERNLQLAEHADVLGFDEFWFGEHHSGGFELSGCPELMIAAAAQRTRRIRLVRCAAAAIMSSGQPLSSNPPE